MNVELYTASGMYEEEGSHCLPSPTTWTAKLFPNMRCKNIDMFQNIAVVISVQYFCYIF